MATPSVAVDVAEDNVLAKHAAFFDRDNNGIIYPWETFEGFRAIGFGLFFSAAAGFLINFLLSPFSRPGKFPSLLFPIEIEHITKCKHGSDTDVYDEEGRFVPSKFEEMFSLHAHTDPNALSNEELNEMLSANRDPLDIIGWLLAYGEWKILYFLCSDSNGMLQKETIRGIYDGSLFVRLEQERKLDNKKRV